MAYFTLAKAQREILRIPCLLTANQLQQHIVRLRDFKRYIDIGDTQRLIEGGYYARVVDFSATGKVPQDMWLQTNLGQCLDEALTERDKRIK